MQTYRVAGMADERTAERVQQTLKAHFRDLVTVETDVKSGEMRLDRARPRRSR